MSAGARWGRRGNQASVSRSGWLAGCSTPKARHAGGHGDEALEMHTPLLPLMRPPAMRRGLTCAAAPARLGMPAIMLGIIGLTAMPGIMAAGAGSGRGGCARSSGERGGAAPTAGAPAAVGATGSSAKPPAGVQTASPGAVEQMQGAASCSLWQEAARNSRAAHRSAHPCWACRASWWACRACQPSQASPSAWPRGRAARARSRTPARARSRPSRGWGSGGGGRASGCASDGCEGGGGERRVRAGAAARAAAPQQNFTETLPHALWPSRPPAAAVAAARAAAAAAAAASGLALIAASLACRRFCGRRLRWRRRVLCVSRRHDALLADLGTERRAEGVLAAARGRVPGCSSAKFRR